jgi:hypothetical protein
MTHNHKEETVMGSLIILIIFVILISVLIFMWVVRLAVREELNRFKKELIEELGRQDLKNKIGIRK